MGKIKYLVMDVDGTLTDGKIYMGENGEVMKAFNIKDGYAISHILPEHGIVPIVITGRTSKIVEYRCKELGITEIHQGCLDKKEKLVEILERYGENTLGDKLPYCACIGDDILDLSLMMICEASGCPQDAVNEVKEKTAYISKFSGGDGAVRDFIEWILKQ